MRALMSRREWIGTTLLGSAGTVLAQPALTASWSIAIVPQFSPAKLQRDWAPLLERLERDSGCRLSLQLQPSIPRFEAEILAGQVDFAYMNPYHQVMARRSQGFVPLVRDSHALSGILVVRADSGLVKVRALDGLQVAFPAPNAFGASLWIRALLAEKEGITIRPSYVQSHSNVYRQVASGRMAAGGGIAHTLAQERDEVRQALRVLLETPSAASHPLSAHPRVPSDVRKAVTQALLRMAGDPAGRELLKAVQLPDPVAADHVRDYAPLSQYNLERYVVNNEAPAT